MDPQGAGVDGKAHLGNVLFFKLYKTRTEQKNHSQNSPISVKAFQTTDRSSPTEHIPPPLPGS